MPTLSRATRPGKPTDIGVIKAFNAKRRAQYLNAHWFMSLAHAREKLEDWQRYYEQGQRPHGAIGYNVAISVHCPDGIASPLLEQARKNPSVRRSKGEEPGILGQRLHRSPSDEQCSA